MKSGFNMRAVATVLATLCLSACGGGGGGDGGGSRNGTPPTNEASVSLASNNVTVSATAWDDAVSREIVITLTNPPQDSLYAGIDYSNSGVEFADIYATSATAGVLIVRFKPGAALAAGTYTDSISIAFCHDNQCARHLRNSPVTVTTQLTVQAGSAGVSLSSGPLSAQGEIANPTLPRGTATLAISNPGPRAPFVNVAPSRLTSHAPSITASASGVSIEYTFQSPVQLGEGVHTENAVVNVCYDTGCAKPLAGSPITVPITYSVTDNAVPEPGLEPVPYLSRTALPHNVIDAEYSHQLGALVMVASYPSNALYLYDMTNQPRQVALGRAPTSVSISPDGTKAAVGHDAKITYIDLASIGQVGAPAPIVLDVGTDVFDIVLDGRGFAHAFPRRDQWQSVHSVAIATNIESVAAISLYAGTRARLHPSGDFIYTANNGLSPSDIAKLDIRTIPALSLGDSPYHGQYEMCGNVWFSENGATIYTPCGNTFRATTTPGQDMTYTGRLSLSQSSYYGYVIRSLSHSQDANEVALIEHDSYLCNEIINEARACYTHVALYDPSSLGRKTVHSVPPIQVGAKTYAQRGQLIFHSADGLRRYMISRLAKMTNPAQEYYLTIMQ